VSRSSRPCRTADIPRRSVTKRQQRVKLWKPNELALRCCPRPESNHKGPALNNCSDPRAAMPSTRNSRIVTPAPARCRAAVIHPASRPKPRATIPTHPCRHPNSRQLMPPHHTPRASSHQTVACHHRNRYSSRKTVTYRQSARATSARTIHPHHRDRYSSKKTIMYRHSDRYSSKKTVTYRHSDDTARLKG
jgi:hypothetical protein